MAKDNDGFHGPRRQPTTLGEDKLPDVKYGSKTKTHIGPELSKWMAKHGTKAKAFARRHAGKAGIAGAALAAGAAGKAAYDKLTED